MYLHRIYAIVILFLAVQLGRARPVEINPTSDRHIEHARPSLDHHDLGNSLNRHLLSPKNVTLEPELVWESNLDAGAISRPRKARKSSSRIAFGQKAKQGMYPYVVYVDGGDYLCTGSIIAKRAILTAAHCVRDENGWTSASDLSIYAGNVLYDYTDTYDVKAS